MREVLGFVLLVCLVGVNGFYDSINDGPFPIDKLLECRLPRHRGSGFLNERRLAVHLIPSAQNTVWRPPDPSAPIYSGDPMRRFTDTALQARLDAFNRADNATVTPPNLLSKELVRADSPSNEFGPCQGMPLSTSIEGTFPGGGDVPSWVDEYVTALHCEPNFEWFDMSDYYYPPALAVSRCGNDIVDQATCSFPKGGSCAMNTSCELEMNMLRWDCCVSYDVAAEEYFTDCGWRRVVVPFYTDCLCICDRKTELQIEVIPLVINSGPAG